ncbi:MAG: hypothetical protein AMS14_10030 [Planctomycetes bacterium DG_20]|nr:MAG: hypothetical protein AMS14_10030 [Planctomycetes bacterium DG_20]
MPPELGPIPGDGSPYDLADPTATRYLTPDIARIHLGSLESLHVTVLNEGIYGGVHAVYLFPVGFPGRYISLRHTDSKGEDVEVGILRDLAEWPPGARELVQNALKRHYFVHVITRINRIRWRYGFLFFDVETDKGPARFYMLWRHDRAVDYGRRGKILLDVDENRHLIPDVNALPPRERNEFLRYIYW